MAGLRKAELVQRNAGLRRRIAELEEALQRQPQEAALDALSDAAADGVLLTDAMGRVVRASEGVVRLTGSPAIELMGQSVASLLDSATAEAARRYREAGGDDGGGRARPSQRLNGEIRRRDGAWSPVQVTLTAWRQDSRVVHAALLRDMSAFRAAAEAMIQGERRFEQLAEVTPVGIFRFDTAGRCIYVSRRWLEITGLSLEDALGDRWASAIHPDDLPMVQRAWAEAQAQSRPCSRQYRVRHTDGSEVWVLGHVQAEKDEAGRVLGFVGTLTDISEIKRLQRELEERETAFRLLFTANPLPMYVYDVDTLEFLEVNDAVVERYGYTREELLSMRLPDIRPPEEQARMRAALEGQIPIGIRYLGGAWLHRYKNGQIVRVEIRSHFVPFAGRRARLVVARPLGEEGTPPEKA
jgi:PAS domain S-box-containing protein